MGQHNTRRVRLPYSMRCHASRSRRAGPNDASLCKQQCYRQYAHAQLLTMRAAHVHVIASYERSNNGRTTVEQRLNNGRKPTMRATWLACYLSPRCRTLPLDAQQAPMHLPHLHTHSQTPSTYMHVCRIGVHAPSCQCPCRTPQLQPESIRRVNVARRKPVATAGYRATHVPFPRTYSKLVSPA